MILRFLLNKNLQNGAATIPVVIAITVLVLGISVGILALGFSESIMSLGQNQSLKAMFYAETGAKDALIKIARNKDYSCVATDCYSIDFATNGCFNNSACAWVSVSAGVGSQADPKIIVSKGRSGDYIRKVQVQTIFDSSLYGEIATTTWSEITN